METRRSSYLCLGFDDQFKPETFRICDEVNSRFAEEHNILKEGHLMSDIEGLKRLCDHLKENGILYFCPGVTASLHTLCDLGITKTNPLEPHYFCPKCRTFEFMDPISSLFNGYNLPHRTCKECGTPLLRNGHCIPSNIIKEQLDSEGNSVVYLAVSSTHYKEVLGLLKNALDYRIPKRIAPGETQVGHVILQQHPLVPSWDIDPNKPLDPNKINDYALTRFLHDSGQVDPVLLMSLEEQGIKPSSIVDVLKLYGLTHGTFNKEALNTLLKYDIKLSDIPVFYDEVYIEALRWGSTPEQAQLIAHQAHFGVVEPQHITLASDYLKYWLTKVNYMFPKPHALEVLHLYYLSDQGG